MRCAIKTCKHNIIVTDANVNINDRLSHQSLLPYLYYYTYGISIEIIHGRHTVLLVLTWVGGY